jgi:uncharacterized repeat protein (TIGR03803 family)
VYRVNKDGSNLQFIKSFGVAAEGLEPSGSLLLGLDGMLYGRTSSGGSNNLGTIFRLNQDGSGFAVLKSFSGSPDDGANPVGDLIQATNGMLYGATQSGGTSNLGALFMLNADDSGYAVLRNFTGVAGEGIKPGGGLIQGGDGLLYGTASQGGAGGQGTVFALNLDGNGFRVLKSFSGTAGDGALPASALVQSPDGSLYGTTYQGGTAGKGTVFKINPDGTAYQVLKSLGGTSGANPQDALVLATNGVLYGTTFYGGSANNGTIFQLNPNGTNFGVIKSYSAAGTDGQLPMGRLLQGSDGALYGVTGWEGTFSGGTLFVISGGSNYAVVVNFNDSGGDGINSVARLIQGGDGALYGTTQNGGSNGQGTVFKINKDGSGYTILKSFTGSNGDGAEPVACVVQGSDGALYGTTSWDSESGGIVSGNGTVFKLNSDGSGYRMLRHFAGGSDGANPLYGQLIQATDGMLYGTTMNGGTTSLGTVFRINMDGSGYLVVKRFSGGNEGYHPYGGLAQAADGALYGTTSSGGVGTQGTVFKMNPDGTGFTVLHGFQSAEGGIPYAGLIQGRDSALYGTTSAGGANGKGTIFKLNIDGTGYTILKSLGVNDGVSPLAPIIQGSNGVLYGTTSFGGNPNALIGAGAVFQLNTDGTGFRVLKIFTQTGEGYSPHAGLLQDADGTLYGTTSSGGRGGNLDGTIFSLVPAAVLSTAPLGPGIEIQVSGLFGSTYRIQRSSALGKGWADVGTVTIGSDGRGKLTGSTAASAMGFYRTAEP